MSVPQHAFFDITPEHILALDDEGLRRLIARLCKADLRRRGLRGSRIDLGSTSWYLLERVVVSMGWPPAGYRSATVSRSLIDTAKYAGPGAVGAVGRVAGARDPTLNKAGWKVFLDALEDPPTPNAELEQAFGTQEALA